MTVNAQSFQIRNEVYETAIEAGLIAHGEVERLICFHERQAVHPITALIAAGVSEDRLYQAFAERSGLCLCTNPVPVAPDAPMPVGAEHCAYFDAIPIHPQGDCCTVATWRWDRRTVIAEALSNLAGVPVALALVTPSTFERLRSGT